MPFLTRISQFISQSHNWLHTRPSGKEVKSINEMSAISENPELLKGLLSLIK